MMVQGMAKDLIQRGGDPGGRGVRRHPGRARGRCVVPADFLLAVGFSTHRPHARQPADADGPAHDAARSARSSSAAWRRCSARCQASAPGTRAAGAARTAAGAHAARLRLSAQAPWNESRSSLTRSTPVCGVDLGAEVEALHRDHDRLGEHVAELRVAQPGGVAGVGEVAGVEPDGRHPGVAQQVPGLGVRAQVDAGRCGRRSRAAPGRRSARRPRTRCRGWRRRRSTSRRRTRRGWPRRRAASETNRSAPVRLANAARSVSSPGASAQRGVVRNAWTPMATSRPSTRWARSCRIASETGGVARSGRLCAAARRRSPRSCRRGWGRPRGSAPGRAARWGRRP